MRIILYITFSQFLSGLIRSRGMRVMIIALPPGIIHLPPPAAHALASIAVLEHPARLVLLVKEVQRLPVEGEIRVVDMDRGLPGARSDIVDAGARAGGIGAVVARGDVGGGELGVRWRGGRGGGWCRAHGFRFWMRR